MIYIIRSIIANIPRKKTAGRFRAGGSPKFTEQTNKRYPTGLRNKSMMAFMLHCSLRISEVVNLRPNSINLTKGKMRVESGKVNKDRDLVILEYLTDLLDSRHKNSQKSSFFFSTLKSKNYIYPTDYDYIIQGLKLQESQEFKINNLLNN